MRILVSSGTSDAINTNQRLRQELHGFKELSRISSTLLSACSSRTSAKKLTFWSRGTIADPSVNLDELVRLARSKGTVVAFWLHDDPYEFDMHWRLKSLKCSLATNGTAFPTIQNVAMQKNLLWVHHRWMNQHFRHP